MVHRRDLHRTWKRLLLALIASGATLALGDLVIGAFGLPEPFDARFLGEELAVPGLFEPDGELFWRPRPGGVPYAIGARSTRGPCPDAPPDARNLRIVAIGDSCTFGVGVRYDDCYAVALARALEASLPAGAVEPVLLAAPGYSSFQSLRWFERERASLRPDVTIVEVGVWNDYVAAVGASDAARARQVAAERASGGLAQLGHRIVERTGRPDLAALRAAFARGEAPFGRRVPIDEFRANLRALIAGARAVGSAVLVVVPPLPAATLLRHPEALEYRAAIADEAARNGATCIDAAASFREFLAGLPAGWSDEREAEAGFPLFLDWVHPTALGHRRIAQLLFEALHAAPPQKLLALRLAAGAREDAASSAVDAVPPIAGPSLASEPPILSARLVERAGPTARFELEVRGPSSCRVVAFAGAQLRDAPACTDAGGFALVAEPDGRPAGRPDLPFRFDRIGLRRIKGDLDAGGCWRGEFEVDAKLLEHVESVYFQALVTKPGAWIERALSTVAIVPLTK